MATTFPENEIEVLRRYLSAELHEALKRARVELTRASSDLVLHPDLFEQLNGPLDPLQREEQGRAFEVNLARRQILAVFDRASLGKPDSAAAESDRPPPIDLLDAITDDVMRHELPGAVDRLNTFDIDAQPADGLPLDRRAFETAFTASPIGFITTRVTKIITTPEGPHEIKVRDQNTLPGYQASARLTAADIDTLFVLLRFLSRTAERTFRLGVIRAEVLFGLARHAEAIQAFGTLLPSPGPRGLTHVGDIPLHGFVVLGDPEPAPERRPSFVSGHLAELIPGVLPILVATADVETDPLVVPRQRFAALRQGFAHLGLGDGLFRALRTPDPSARDAIRAAYDHAIAEVASLGISSENPWRLQVEQYAAMQKGKLDAGMNVLGYRDGYVPILRPATLQALAERRIQAASEAAQRFEAFKSKADQIQDTLRELDFQADIKQIELAIADEQIAKANDQVDIADRQVGQLQDQLDALATSTLVSIGGSLLQAAASAALAGSTGPAGPTITGTSVPGTVGALSGAASTLAGYSARKDELKFQKEIAAIGARVARRDVAIAELGKRIAETSIEFLEDRVRRIQNRELNPDLYYAAGEAFRALAQRHLDVAILWAYLFERSVAFLRLEPTLRTIQLDYLQGPGGLLTAPDRLRADLDEVVDLNVPITKFQFLTETYSLRSLYPLEFNRFLQRGRMDFALSLYELSKRRPGVHRQRIKRVQVELQFPPPSGFTGRIRHRGSFLLRDKDTTPLPGDGPFLPGGEQLTQALATLGEGTTQGLPIGGVIPFLLDVDTLELSPNEAQPEPGEPALESLSPIEGYGPAGDWTLEVENVDLRFITDALLKITNVIPESD